MRPTLPSAPGRNSPIFGVLLALVACHHEPPVTPAPPLPAETEIPVQTMEAECAGLVAALDRYRACPNLDDDDRAWLRSTIEYAQQSYEAGTKGHPDEQAQHVIAVACKRAALSVDHANERCHAGPKPRVDDD